MPAASRMVIRLCTLQISFLEAQLRRMVDFASVTGFVSAADGDLAMVEFMILLEIVQIISVNTNDVTNVPHEETIRHLQSNPKVVDIVVSREVSIPQAPTEVCDNEID